MNCKNKVFTTLLVALAGVILSLPASGKSFGSRSSSSSSRGSRSGGSSWSSRSSSGSSSWGGRSSTTPKLPFPSSSSTWGGKTPSTTNSNVSGFNKPSTSGRSSIMQSQTKQRTQNQHNKRSVEQSTPQSSSPSNTTITYKTPQPRQRVIVKKYYYGGQPRYMWYDRGRYYDPYSFSATWWLLHWAELEQQREIMNDIRFASMRAQVEAMRARGVVPDASYTENVAPLSDDVHIHPVRGIPFYFTCGLIVMIAIITIIVIIKFL